MRFESLQLERKTSELLSLQDTTLVIKSALIEQDDAASRAQALEANLSDVLSQLEMAQQDNAGLIGMLLHAFQVQ
jgi:hypothetical protein